MTQRGMRIEADRRRIRFALFRLGCAAVLLLGFLLSVQAQTVPVDSLALADTTGTFNRAAFFAWYDSTFSNVAVTPSGINWRWINPYPVGNYLLGLEVNSTNSLILANDPVGRILRSSDTGATWNTVIINSGTYLPLSTVELVQDTVAIAVGYRGGIYESSDAGNSWSKLPTTFSNSLWAVDFLNRDTGFVGGTGNSVFSTTNGGTTWSQSFLFPVVTHINGLSFADARHGIVVGDSGSIYITTNAGSSWTASTVYGITPSAKYSLNAAVMTGQLSAFAVSSNGGIYRTIDGGATWISSFPVIGEDFGAVDFPSPRNGWAVGTHGIIYHTSDAGGHWLAQNSNTNQQLVDVKFADTLNGWAVGFKGALLRTTDGGNNWLNLSQRTISGYFRSAHFPTAKYGWAVGSGGTIIHTTDFGAHWQPQLSPTNRSLNTVWFTDTLNGWAAGWLNGILHTTNGGANWVVHDSLPVGVIFSVRFYDANIGWAGGLGGRILVTTNGGATWRLRVAPKNMTVRDLRFTGPLTGVAVGGDGLSWLTTDGGITWTSAITATSQALFSVAMLNADTGVAVGANGAICQTFNGGRVWNGVASGVKQNLYGVTLTGSGYGWAVGNSGRILYTRDYGSSWYIDQSPTLNALTAIVAFDSVTNLVFGSNSTILLSGDSLPSSIIALKQGLRIPGITSQNFPNPFNPQTAIAFTVPQDDYVTVQIFNVLGQEIEKLADRQYLARGYHVLLFDGAQRASGVYFYRITSALHKLSYVGKMMLVK